MTIVVTDDTTRADLVLALGYLNATANQLIRRRATSASTAPTTRHGTNASTTRSPNYWPRPSDRGPVAMHNLQPTLARPRTRNRLREEA